MSLDDADKFFKEMLGRETQFIVFLEPEEAIDTAKKIIELMGNDVGIWIPFNADGMVNEDDTAISKEEAKKYIEEYGDEGGVKVYRRCLDFYEERDDEETIERSSIERSLWLETYCRIGEEANTGIDVLEWG